MSEPYRDAIARHLAEFLAHMRANDRPMAARSLGRAWRVISPPGALPCLGERREVVLWGACSDAYDELWEPRP